MVSMLNAPQRIHDEWEIVLANPDPPYETYSYTYYLRRDGWNELQVRLRALHADRFVIVVDASFPMHLVEQVRVIVEQYAPCAVLTFLGKEEAKTIETVGALGGQAIAAGATRASVIVALGGGLAGNVAGLLAGTLFRGISFVHIPTTLLAMSDSCLSLKQGVNSGQGKNHFGLFKAPTFVWADLSFLDSLPTSEIRSALCELCKNVLAICPERYEAILAEVCATLASETTFSDAHYAHFIAFCIEAKTTVMRQDALEKHGAVVLEYGHTVGHALELLYRLPHGMAIALGMIVEAMLSFQLGLLSQSALQSHYRLLQAIGAPTVIVPEMQTHALLEVMLHDNKRGYLPSEDGFYDVVLLEALGRPRVTDGKVLTRVSREQMRRAIDTCRQPKVLAVAS